VEATKALMESFVEFVAQNGKEMLRLREETIQNQQKQTAFPIAWKWDRTKSTEITFKGFEAGMKKSEISGLDRLYYDRNRPFEKRVPFYNSYVDTLTVTRPAAYLIPQGWWKVIERLQTNGIQMIRMKKDTTIEVEAYRIEDFNSTARPYEGHHPNSHVQITTSTKKIIFRSGDYLIPLSQKGVRFLIETLEPQATDSYFAWNFFDSILGQKEGFSDYVFEERAAEFLQQHPEVKAMLEEQRKNDVSISKSANAQLEFVYKHSPFYEKEHLQYPVYRIKER
jgi:hypothetical protein